jgi:hypothetical protein
MMQTQYELNADMTETQCTHDAVMLRAEAVCHMVTDTVIAECNTDDG